MMRAEDKYNLLPPVLVIQKLLEILHTEKQLNGQWGNFKNQYRSFSLLEPGSEALEFKFLKN